MTTRSVIVRGHAAAQRLLVAGLVAGALIHALSALAAPGQPGSQLAQAASAAEAAPGRVSSVLFHDLPAGFPVEVITFDDTDANIEIRDRFEEELQKAGQVVAADAPLELSFTTDVLEGGAVTREPTLGRIGGGTEHDVGTRGSDTGVDVEVNVWSSTQDSVLGGRQPRNVGEGARYHMTAQLRDRGTGQVLWQGEAFYELLGGDRARLARSMVPPLVATYGRSVKDEPFEIE